MTSPRSEPILPLTSIRFLAALYIVLLHSAAWSNHLSTSTWAGRFFGAGYTAVGFFFVLSGYILAHVYLDTERPFQRSKFWISRFARIYPLLAASLLFDLPNDFIARLSLHSLGSAVLRSFVELVSELLLLQSWDGHFRTINAPSWSLSAEAFFYLAFPFLAVIVWRWKGWKAAGTFLLLWSLALASPVIVTLTHPSLFVEVDQSRLQWAVELMPVFRIFEFCAGVALCAIQKSLGRRYTPGQLGGSAPLLLLSAGILFWVAIDQSNHIPLLVMSNGFLLPIYSLIIIGLANSQGRLRRLLSHRSLVLLGESSYAVYLLHTPVWNYFSRVRRIDTLPVWSVYLVFVIGLSILSFLFLERPARKKILAIASVRPPVLLDQEQVATH